MHAPSPDFRCSRMLVHVQVRGKMYLSDGRKMKSHPALFSTLALEISHLDDKVMRNARVSCARVPIVPPQCARCCFTRARQVDHVASRDNSARAKYHRALAAAGQVGRAYFVCGRHMLPRCFLQLNVSPSPTLCDRRARTPTTRTEHRSTNSRVPPPLKKPIPQNCGQAGFLFIVSFLGA